MSHPRQRRAAPVVVSAAHADLPVVHPDTFRSYQCMFHIRVSRDAWTYDSKNGWLLDIERVNLRPGSDGCGGDPQKLALVDDTSTLLNWAKRDQGKWVVLRGGDIRLAGLPGILDGGDGSPQFRVNELVQVGSQQIDMNLPFWEEILDHGAIQMNWEVFATFGRALAKALWGIDGPPERTVRNQLRKTRQLFAQVSATLDGARSPSRKLKERVDRLERMVKEMEAYLAGNSRAQPAPEPVVEDAPAEAPKAIEAAPRQLSLMEQIAMLSPDEKAALVGVLAPKPAPVARAPRKPPTPKPAAQKPDEAPKGGAPANLVVEQSP